MNWHEFLDDGVQEVLRGKRRWVLPRLLKQTLFGEPSRQAVVLVRWAQLLEAAGYRRMAKVASVRLVKMYGVYIGHRSVIGPGLKLPHPTSVVVGRDITLGRNVRLFQQVTVAAPPRKDDGNMRRMGDDVTVYPSAKFVGAGSVGNNVVVGANAVVNKAFGDNVVLAGIPAHVIRTLEPSAARRFGISRAEMEASEP